MTFWGEQRDWTKDVLNLGGGGWETCFVWGEVDCMKKAENAVKAGGVAFFLIDANILTDGGSDNEEDMRWRRAAHQARTPVPGSADSSTARTTTSHPIIGWHTWVGSTWAAIRVMAGDGDPVSIRLWSWAREYVVTGTVDAFTEYLYAVVTGY